MLGGAIVTQDAALADAVLSWRTDGGAIPGPFESWLVLRGIKTLPLRIERASANALAVATFLAGHSAGQRRALPGNGAVAPRPSGRDAARLRPAAVLRALRRGRLRGRGGAAARLIRPCDQSFGGVESSWERRARWPAETAPDTLIRMSCGVASVLQDLLADPAAALEVGG